MWFGNFLEEPVPAWIPGCSFDGTVANSRSDHTKHSNFYLFLIYRPGLSLLWIWGMRVEEKERMGWDGDGGEGKDGMGWGRINGRALCCVCKQRNLGEGYRFVT